MFQQVLDPLDIFRKLLGWSLGLLVLFMGLVYLQSTPVLEWMVP